jgi:hypothetical protein
MRDAGPTSDALAHAARPGYRSGAHFERSSREDDQLPITARPLATGAADGGVDTAANGNGGGATDADSSVHEGAVERGVGMMAAAGEASAGAASTSHDSDVLEELK